MRTGIHVFRKDLRVSDNLALIELAGKVDSVVGLFIFDSIQFQAKHHSENAAQFISECVLDLNRQCGGNLVIAHGEPAKVLKQMIRLVNPVCVSFNADFTPYALERDALLASVCKDIEVIINYDDQTLAPMVSLLKSDGSPFVVFGPFFRSLTAIKINKPRRLTPKWLKPRYPNHAPRMGKSKWKGGRAEALKHFKNFASEDRLNTETSRLSAYLNQGCVSVREVHHRISDSRSIAWRDFFLCMYRFHPKGNSYTEFIDERYNRINWPRVNKSDWGRLWSFNTGFLMIDASMRELVETGFLNNRARLLLATFWIKYLQINPFDSKYGSQIWWSRLLVDCSASQNKLNHQWMLGDLDLSGRRFAMKGTPALAGRMIRIDNGMIRKYDPDFSYIQKWIPEFANLSARECRAKAKKVESMYNWTKRYLEYTRLLSDEPRKPA